MSNEDLKDRTCERIQAWTWKWTDLIMNYFFRLVFDGWLVGTFAFLVWCWMAGWKDLPYHFRIGLLYLF